jgi:hypothetical protein
VSGTPLNPEVLEVAPGFEHEPLQGSIPSLASEEELGIALEKAFEYRGDVTITCKDGSVIEGYVYDRRAAATLNDSQVRVLAASGSGRVNVRYADIAALAFTGRDTAAGKSWEAWVRKYWEKKAAGESPAIEPDRLD